VAAETEFEAASQLMVCREKRKKKEGEKARGRNEGR